MHALAEPLDLPFLPPSEFRIFSVLCKRHPLTIREISLELSRRDPEIRQGYTTLATLLQRLIRKGYVVQDGAGPAPHLFRPSVPFDVALRRHIERFLDDFAVSEPVELRAVLEMVMDRLVPVSG